MKEKQNWTKVTAPRYQRSGKKAQSVILDEFTANTGYNRKYAIHLLANGGKRRHEKINGKKVVLKVEHAKRAKRVYKKYYDRSVKEKLTLVWKSFDWQCGRQHSCRNFWRRFSRQMWIRYVCPPNLFLMMRWLKNSRK